MPSRPRPRRRSVAPSRGLNPIPPGYPTLIPYLAVAGGVAALEFYRKAFGAKELARVQSPDGKLIHGRLKIGDSLFMISDVFPGAGVAAPSTVGTTTVTLHIYSKNVDALWDRAVAAGAKVTMPLENQYWGERYGHLLDPFGHHWSLSMRVRMTRAEKAAKQKAAMESFSRGEHPSREPPFGDA
ncbi:MAG TPA: VOC family protein [Thermoplasmata archaeon]|nr:VOC family protein [Thermoplasmata archaeon]